MNSVHAIITGIELGSHSIKVAIARFRQGRGFWVVGAGEEPSLKVVKGEIVHAAVVQDQLRKAIATAEQAADVEIRNVFLAVTGNHIGMINSVSSVAINAVDHRVTEEDHDAAVRNAYSCPLPAGKRAIHIFERHFLVDGHEVRDPVGLAGAKLEADVHIVFGQFDRLENSRRIVVEALGIGEHEPREVVFSGIAAGMGVLRQEEAAKGAMVIDVGAGVTEYAVFAADYRCLHTGRVTIGGEDVANDLLPESRLQKLFAVILADLQKQNVLKRIGWGIKLVGGGATIPRITDLAQWVFQTRVEIGMPAVLNDPNKILNSPRYATPAGLLHYGYVNMPSLP